MIRLSKRLYLRAIPKRRKSLYLSISKSIKPHQYSTLRQVLFTSYEPEFIEEQTHSSTQQEVTDIPLRQLYETIGIKLTQQDLDELGGIENLEDLKEMVFDTNLWMSIKISPVKKAKIMGYLKLTPIPLSRSREKFLTVDSLDDIEFPSNAVYPYDTTANDINNYYALPMRLCGESIDKVVSFLAKGTDCVLYGNDFKGKTTALWEIRDLLMIRDPEILPLYIDLKRFSTGLQFDFTKAIVHAMYSTCGDFESYEKLLKFSPKDALDRIATQCELHGKKLVLLIDHIEDLNWSKQMEVLVDGLDMPRRTGSLSSKPHSVIVAGTESFLKDLTFHDPNWNTYCHKELWNPTFLKSHIGALAKNIKLFHFPFDTKALTKIKNLTGGHPWYINRLLQEIKEFTSYSSDPIAAAAHRLFKKVTLNGLKDIEFDIGFVLSSLFASGSVTCSEYVSLICGSKLGWFNFVETHEGRIVVPSNPIIRESMAYALSENFCDKRFETSHVLNRVVDYKSPECIFSGWQRYVRSLCQFENPFLFFWKYMQGIASLNGLMIKHEWPAGKPVLSVMLKSDMYPSKVHRITLVDDGRNKNNKEFMLVKYIIPEAQKVIDEGLTKGTIFLPGYGRNEVLEICGIELSLFYEEN